MNTTDVPFAFLRFQYQIARIPLQLIEEQMAAWMGSEAPPRVFYARSLGALDATVGSLLGDPKLEKRGAALIERSDALGRAAQLDATATQKQEQADDELKAKRDNAIKDPKRRARSERASRQGSADRCRTAEARRGAGCREGGPPPQSSRPTTWLPSARSSAEAVKREEQAKITAAEQKATAAAESKLKDAQATRSDAASKRAQADQIEQLADVEKQKRQSEPSKDA